MIIQQYKVRISAILDDIVNDQADAILSASELVSETIKKNGLIYIFGCGHSHILAEECFYRAGGLACVAPIFYEPLMLHESATLSSKLEKQSGLTEEILNQYSFSENDILICISTSDKNAVPVELAAHVHDLGIPVICISSSSYFRDEVHNAVNMHLHEVCDIWIDNKADHGDACLQMNKVKAGMCPTSTISGAFILNCLLAEGAQSAMNDGADVPIYLSGNISGGAEYNKALIEKFFSRIKCL